MLSRDVRRTLTALRSGVRGVLATPLIFAASVATMAAGLLLLGTYLLVVENMRGVLDRFGSDLRVVAYLEEQSNGATPVRADLERAATALPGARRVRLVSPETAMERLRSDLGAQADILDGLTRNPLPGSLEVEVSPDYRAPEQVAALARALEELPGVDEVRYGADWIEGYARVLSAVEWGGAVLGLFLMLVLGAVVAGTVRLAVHARLEEIEIQRLVGAGGWFVRLPFYVEGALQGATAAALALGILYGLFALGLPVIREPLELLLGRAEPIFFGTPLVLGLLGVGVGLGVGGAAVSLVRLEGS